MSSCQDELFARRDPPDYEVKCVYCGLTAMRSTMYSRVGYRQYSCRDTEACDGGCSESSGGYGDVFTAHTVCDDAAKQRQHVGSEDEVAICRRGVTVADTSRHQPQDEDVVERVPRESVPSDCDAQVSEAGRVRGDR
jgi:hypothetical protein